MRAGPFDSLSARARRRAIAASALATAAQLAAFLPLERRMRAGAGAGIIAFELAGTEARAVAMADRWGADGRAAARRSLALDYPFPPTYATLQALACTAAADRFAAGGRPALAAAGGALAWSQYAAAGFDYVENTALLAVLAGRTRRMPGLARRAALVKFALIAAGWGYVLISRSLPSHSSRASVSS